MPSREKYNGVIIPAPSTIAKYGLTQEDWEGLVDLTEGLCPVCSTRPSSDRLVIDHRHIVGWIDKPDEYRRRYVRGVVCNTCNHYVLTRYLTPEKSDGAAQYLRERDSRWNEQADQWWFDLRR